MKKGFYILFFVINFIACTKTTPTTICVNNDTIYVYTDKRNRQRMMKYSFESKESIQSILKEDTIIIPKNMLLADTLLAYHLAKNDGYIQFKFSIENVIDTTLHIFLPLPSNESSNSITVIGNCAPLISNYDSKEYVPKIRKWLYKHNFNNESDSVIDKIFEYYMLLEEKNALTTIKKYYVKEEIPIIVSNPNKLLPQYRIDADMKADNYYVVLARDDRELNFLLEDICINQNNYLSVKTLPNKIRTYRATLESGVYCAFLVGINKNWSQKIIPFGLICIDNDAPLLQERPFVSIPDLPIIDYNWMYFRDKINIAIAIANEKYPPYQGFTHIAYGNFGGYAPFFKIPYTFSWSGDVRYIRIINKKTRDWSMLANFPKSIIIDTHKHSAPHQAIYETFLPNHGDNYLPIELEDKRGNISYHIINIATGRIERTPQINIDNTIYNNIN